jgi:hypothetical protein
MFIYQPWGAAKHIAHILLTDNDRASDHFRGNLPSITLNLNDILCFSPSVISILTLGNLPTEKVEVDPVSLVGTG